MKDKTCKDRVREAFRSRMDDIRALWEAGYGEEVDEIGRLEDYGLAIDHVDSNTFRDQTEGYWRYQISWGGPSEEFRLYRDGRIEFWFLDWFDGASIPVTGADAAIVAQIVKNAK